MELSLSEASILMGKTPRQMRYLIKHGKVKAKKRGGQWVLDRDELPMTRAQHEAHDRKAAALAVSIQSALEPHLTPVSKHYSVRQMAAFKVGAPLLQSVRGHLDDAHPATMALEQALICVTHGCHSYHHADKLDAYRLARKHTSMAVARLYFQCDTNLDALAHQIEVEMMPAIAGLIRRSETKRKKSP